VFRLLAARRLIIEPLISHILKPKRDPAAYEGLRFNKEDYNGVLFNWL
jgi:hypothetical protein